MPEPSRFLTVPEAMLMRWWNTTHRVLNIYTTAQTLTPSSGKKIVVSSMRLSSDMTAPTVALSCTGVDSWTARGANNQTLTGLDGIFIGSTDQGITFTKGGSSGTYSEIEVVYYEL